MSSQAYTPGLKRKEFYIVKKLRRLPLPGDVLVKEGDTVSHDTVVARTQVPGEPYMIKVIHLLGVEPEGFERYMLKKVGEIVEENEPLALRRYFFGLFEKICLSPVTGTVELISTITGQAIVRGLPTPIDVNAYLPGTIIEVLPKEGVVVQTPAAFIQGILGIGGEAHGDIMMMSKTPEDVLEAEQITQKCVGKVLVGGSLVTGDALHKAVEVGARGIVVGGITDKDMIDLLGHEMGVAITGHEEVGITLIITEGFGKMAMSERTFELLKKFEGNLACVNGTTQIRAGVMRPEIIIPQKISSTKFAEFDEEDIFGGGLKPGTPIRLIREPYFGALGKVVSLPVELQKLETGSEVRVLEAELEDGRRVIVPRANVEIIEE